MDLANIGSVALYRVTGKVIRQKSAEAIVAGAQGGEGPNTREPSL